MSRLDIERQNKLEPKRINETIEVIKSLDIEVYNVTKTSFQFQYNGSPITFFPYSGWHTGKTINDGRGFYKLLKQIKNE